MTAKELLYVISSIQYLLKKSVGHDLVDGAQPADGDGGKGDEPDGHTRRVDGRHDLVVLPPSVSLNIQVPSKCAGSRVKFVISTDLVSEYDSHADQPCANQDPEEGGQPAVLGLEDVVDAVHGGHLRVGGHGPAHGPAAVLVPLVVVALILRVFGHPGKHALPVPTENKLKLS